MDTEDESASYLKLFNEGPHNYLLHSSEDGLNDAFPVEPIFTEIASDWPQEGFPILLSGSLITEDLEDPDSESPNTNVELLNEESHVVEDNTVALFSDVDKNGLIVSNDVLLKLQGADGGDGRETTVTHVINGDTYSVTYADAAREEVCESDENVEVIQLLDIDGSVTTFNKNLLSVVDGKDRTTIDNFYVQVQANKCKLCSFLCESVEEIVAHFRVKHQQVHHNEQISNGVVEATKMRSILNSNQDKKYTLYLCSDCGSGYSNKEDLKQHMIVQHKMVQISSSAATHAQASSEKPGLPESDQRLPKVSAATYLKKQKALRKVKCSIKGCPLRFDKDEARKRHEDCHVGQNKKQFMCPVCKTKFSIWRICSMHMWKCHSIDLGLLTCPMCNKFKSNSLVRVVNHMSVHNDERPFMCTSCGKSFKQVNQLRNHEVIHKDPHEAPNWYTQKQCEFCDRYFANSKSLKTHIKSVHDKFKPFICNICGHQTARKEMLKLHHRQHTGDKPFHCSYCEYKTGDKNCLRKHVLRHFGAAKYSCPYCSYQSIQTRSLKVHLSSKHPGKAGTYSCDLCRYTTINHRLYLSHLKCHETKKTNGKIEKGANVEDSENRVEDETHTFLSNEHSEEAVDTGGITIPAGFDLQLSGAQASMM